ncbi:CopG family transcriptional regulator [Aetokthonos hydrillicola Thurmond2011]|jgi:predicted DNA-binding protein|uniref:CopG family transcriptional regulator n=1 Tax=Aetokthonos hydrillicola Thurmond2011 TaxID=2712845 RepID=A0AAP5MAD7_9CYAN|nr:CopG family transcriptional regulator [Aetokthonos hydrillicola]MBO3460311.1 CopG family transcriptional regulator [Aetokthonos hydrillicola CCALA 1050]MDR9898025.1 CopG family transcriptional regulator [Aetokthonos hydrillicola Thurmond2011]
MSKKLAVKQISLVLASDEAKILEKYCARTGKTATDVVRELVRALP